METLPINFVGSSMKRRSVISGTVTLILFSMLSGCCRAAWRGSSLRPVRRLKWWHPETAKWRRSSWF